MILPKTIISWLKMKSNRSTEVNYTLHPIVVNYKENGKLVEKSFCFISDDLEHDTEFVFELQRELVKILK